MVETITPVVYGRRRRYIAAVALHTGAAAASGALIGTLLGAIGWIAGAPWGGAGHLVVAAIAAAYLLREAAGVPVPLPQARRQVPEWWRRFYSPPTAAALYGAGLGIGFFTYLSFGTYAAVAAGVIAAGSPAQGAVVCGVFGLARGLTPAIGAFARDEDDAADIVDRLGRTGRGAPRAANAAALGLVVVAGAAAAGAP